MCLIITGHANKVRSTLLDTEDLLLDIFKTNPDGIGVMYGTESEGLKIVKKLPKSLKAARSFIERMPCDERLLAIHFRWTTHGDTNLENCHPYVVLENKVGLMHNGVLSTGNMKDRTKSDTWHFIEDYLKKAVAMAPALPFDQGFATMVKDFIGHTNRFVFMNDAGDMMILNKLQGLEHDGMWFSNTYAWKPSLLIKDYKGYSGGRTRSYSTGYGGYGTAWDDYEGYDHTRYMGGGQSSGSKSGVQHNRPQLPEGSTVRGTTPAGSSPAAAPAPNAAASPAAANEPAAFTQADAQAEAEWEAAVRRAHTEWQRDARAERIGRLADIKDGRSSSGEAEGKERSPIDSEKVSCPQKEELVTALADADVDKFDVWLGMWPQVVLSMLFHLYRAGPTKWAKQEDLASYERTVYDACIKGEKNWLIDQCRDENASSSAVAEVICYYLNWYAWPQVVASGNTDAPAEAPAPSEPAEAAPPATEPAEADAVDGTQPNTEWPFPTEESMNHHVTSEAQLSQGGDGPDNSIYVG